MKKVSIHPHYTVEELLKLQEKGLFERQDFRARAKAVYRAEKRKSKEDYGELNKEQYKIFFHLFAKKARQGEAIEDIDLSTRLKNTYKRSLTTETEIAEINNKEELVFFLDLLKEKADRTGYLNDRQWLEKAKEVYIRDLALRASEADRDLQLKQQTTQELFTLNSASEKINSGCEQLIEAIANNDSAIHLQQAYSLLIQGSDDLLNLSEKYLYPQRNWLQKKLHQKLPILKSARIRREERIKSVRYILDYLQQFITVDEMNKSDIHNRRLQSYLKVLPIEAAYLTEWLMKEIKKQQPKSLDSKSINSSVSSEK